jgi:ATP-dependent helicase STH1/SNF2
MNDEEINEIISRSEEETLIFHEMDLQRERDLAEQWKAQGHRGKPPPPLMQLEELPECYRTDAPFEVKEEEEGPEGRGARRRNVVSYNDGLSDEQWAMVSTSWQCDSTCTHTSLF